MSRSWSTRTRLVVPAVLLTMLAAAGCAPVQAGSAATMGNVRITTQELDTNVNDVRSALNGAEPSNIDPAKTVTYVLQTMVTVQLFKYAAVKNNVKVPPSQVDVVRLQLENQNGGAAGLKKVAANQGIPESQIDGVLAANYIAKELGKKLAPSADSATQLQVAQLYLSKLSVDLKTTVSPRYGEWNAAKLSIVSAPNSVSSTPAS